MPTRRSGLFAIVAIGLVSFIGSSAFASGRMEINQAIVDEAGGFPYLISVSGNYVLTSDLSVPTDVTAIRVNVFEDFTLDLNGFRIKGSSSCTSSLCSEGSGYGVAGFLTASAAKNSSIYGGEISNFGGDCIALQGAGRVERMRVSECGRHGIRVGDGSVVKDNIVSEVRLNGLDLGVGAIYANNTVSNAGFGPSGSGVAVVGGMATAGNYCDDGSCTLGAPPVPAKSFYATTGSFNGANALSSCSVGYHMASIWEILDVSSLEYNTTLGVVRPDSGVGPARPPLAAWVRTGGNSASSPGAFVGVQNCNVWTSSSSGANGTTVNLAFDWTEAATQITPWVAIGRTCNLSFSVWCVED